MNRDTVVDTGQAVRDGEIVFSSRWYVLGVLTVVYVINFVDRQILTILAPYIKADLHIGNAQIGLLYGTCFALFYSILGLPLARLADGWNRVKTLSLGLAVWSVMTALSGTASGFIGLGLARIGVGVGEASATPSAVSLLQDYFPKKRRATAIAIYMSGIFIGAGLAGVVAGPLISWWDSLLAAGVAPFQRSSWQMVFIIAGTPGIFLAILVWSTIREPARSSGQTQPASEAAPIRGVLADLASMTPPFSVLSLRRAGASTSAIRRNLLLLACCILLAVSATMLTDALVASSKLAPIGHVGRFVITTNLIQWGAIAVGIYAAGSWVQMLCRRDKTAADLIVRSPAMRSTILGIVLQNTVNYIFGGFSFVYGVARFGFVAADALTFGLLVAAAGFTGAIVGGLAADFLAKRLAAGRLWLTLVTAGISGVAFLWQALATSRWEYFSAFFCAQLTGAVWFGAASATAQSLVPPRLRGTAIAYQWLLVNLVGLGLGPYCVGLVSDITGSLQHALIGSVVLIPAAIFFYVRAAIFLPEAEARTLALANRS